MESCQPNLLSAFVDGELEPHARDAVVAHLAQCVKCQAEVDELRELSSAFARQRFEGLRPQERARLHAALEERVDAPIWRLGGAIGLIAASILVVAGTWLTVIPQKPAPMGPVASTPTWEQIASTGRVDIPSQLDQTNLDEWMLASLNGSQP